MVESIDGRGQSVDQEMERKGQVRRGFTEKKKNFYRGLGKNT